MNIKEELLSTGYFINNEYLDLYVKHIEKNLTTKEDKPRTQKHHIVPKRCYELLNCSNKKFINRKENLVNLLYKDHILAHYYLALCAKQDEFKFGCMFAFYRMTQENPYKFDISDVEKLDKFQELQELYQIKNSERATQRLLGHEISQETREKIGKSNKQRYNDYKYVAIHKDIVNKVVKEDLLNEYLNDGWEIGQNDPQRCKKISESQKKNPNRSMLGRHQSEHQKETIKKFLTGRPMSQEACIHMSKAHSGKIFISNDETKESFYTTQEEFEKIYKSKGFYNGRLRK